MASIQQIGAHVLFVSGNSRQRRKVYRQLARAEVLRKADALIKNKEYRKYAIPDYANTNSTTITIKRVI